MSGAEAERDRVSRHGRRRDGVVVYRLFNLILIAGPSLIANGD